MGLVHTGRLARRTIVRLLCVLGLVLPMHVNALTIHVSPGGADSNPGTSAKPVGTVGAALDLLRGKEGERRVVLSRGIHRVDSTIEIGRADSGAPSSPLQIVGADGGAVLSGFRVIPKGRWSKVTSAKVLDRIGSKEVRSRLMQCVLPASAKAGLGALSRRGFDADDHSSAPPAMLYMGTRQMCLARWPNVGTVKATEVIEAGPVRYDVDDEGWKRFWSEGGIFQVEGDRAGNWEDPSEAWVNGRFGNAWEWSFNRVKAVRAGGKEIELAYGEVSGIGADELHPPEFFYENVLEELDRPGEYFIDRDRAVIYFLPPSGATGWVSSMRLSWGSDALMKIEGAKHVKISGLRFDGGRSDGIVIKDGLDIDLENLHLSNLAGDGIVVDGREIRISGLVAEELGARGVLLRGGDPKQLSPSGNVISGSRFVATGWWGRAFRPAVKLEGVGHRVVDCQFSELPHMAIEVDGNDFKIEGCWFSRTCLGLRDMCAIYFNLGDQPQKRGTVIRGNLFQDIGVGSDGARGGVYLDNGTMGVSITDNVFHRVGEGADGWSVMNHGGAYVRVENNVFIDCAVPYHVAYWWNTWGKDDLPRVREQWQETLASKGARLYVTAYPELATFFEEDRVHPTSNTFSRNLIANPRRKIQARRGWTSFGGPARTLNAEENVMSEQLKGLSFDEYGRPVVPGWRPWRAIATAQ